MLLHVGLYVLCSAAILQAVCQILPAPFIDEIFHIPQAQHYCNGSFSEWNDKITTPPGLYLSSLLLQVPFLILSPHLYCTVLTLRAVNVIFNAINMLLIYYIMKEISSTKQTNYEGNNAPQKEYAMMKIQALTISMFPVNYFFSFLYYTDPGSTLFVLAAYLANLKSMHKTSAFLGLFSVFFRQTNIVWVLFLAGCTAVKEMVKADSIEKIETSPDIKDKLVRFLVGIVSAAIKYLLVIDNFLRILKLVWPYLFVLASFAMFILINGGIVLGDKLNHEVSLHAPQLLYFFGFALFFSSPFLISLSQIRNFFAAVVKNPLKFMTFALICILLIIKYTHIHIFVLSDNRHYTFYLCRYVLKYPLFRLLLVPLYIYAGWAMNQRLDSPRCLGIWKLVLLICICAVTVPQKLIEVRYFIIPYILFRVNIRVTEMYQVVLEFLLYFLINAFTLYVFFTKEIVWPDINDPQRIIW
ncbi:dol-P-Glc:Glc(2)Man(9)GlcNAc(2)-PP-Dol alpha-1,2-glucosyltransferase-like isoform X1 [Styela clava]